METSSFVLCTSVLICYVIVSIVLCSIVVTSFIQSSQSDHGENGMVCMMAQIMKLPQYIHRARVGPKTLGSSR